MNDLTKDEIMALEGRDLDVAVAKRVMDINVEPVVQWVSDPSELKPTLPSVPPERVRYYSTYISAAWRVIERIREQTGDWMLVSKQREDHYVAYQQTSCGDPDFGDWFAYGSSAPEAICRAALLSVIEEDND